MRGLVGRLNYRDAVLSTLDAILLFYPPGRQFTDDFPKLKSMIREQFDAGVSASSSALQIAEGILRNFIQQLDKQEKDMVFDALIEAGRRGFAEVVRRQVHRV